MVRFQQPHVMSKDHNVKVRFHPASTTEDMMDFKRPVRRRKPNSIIIHTGTHDLTKSTNTMRQVKKMAKEIEEMEGGREITPRH